MRYVSNSELRVLATCRRKWYLTFVRRLVPRQEGASGVAGLGTRVHAALYERYARGADPLEAFKAAVGRDLEARPELEAELAKQYGLGLAILEGYEEWVAEEGLDADLEELAAEQEVQAELPGTGATLVGKLDRAVRRRTDGARLWVDYKTVAGLGDRDALLQTDPQPLTYRLIQELRGGEGRLDAALYRMLRRVKRTKTATPPFYKQVEVRHSRDQLRAYYWQVTGQVRRLVELERELQGARPEVVHALVPPSPSRDCTWSCAFAKVCLAGLLDETPARAEAALDGLYMEGDPYARYETLGEEVE